MNTGLQIASGLLAGILLSVTSHRGSMPSELVLILWIVLVVVVFIFGTKLPLWVRVSFSTFLLYWGYISCLYGRTMENGFSGYTFSMALLMFSIYAFIPSFALFRAWRKKVSILLFAMFFPLSLGSAALVAGYEEYKFIKDHPNGAEVTARWTASNHWLAYDAETGILEGSD